MVTFIDDYSRYVVSSFIRHRSEVIDRFLDFKAMIENQLIRELSVFEPRMVANLTKIDLLIFVKVPGLYTKQQFRIRHSKMDWLNE